MKSALIAIAFAVLAAGCAGIPKPDWTPGNTPPRPQVGERATCPLLAEWAWNGEHKQWVCVPTRPTYYYPPVYYGPAYPVYGPIIYGPAFIPCCYYGRAYRRR